MKKKKDTKDIFDTETSFLSLITDPYQVFAALFSVAPISDFRKMINKMMLHAGINKVYKPAAPCDFLYYLRLLKSVMKAAHALRKVKKSAIQVLETDMFNKKYYCRSFQHSDEWADFPRFLSKNEYCNPYLVFKRMFKFQDLDDWSEDLNELGEYALSNNAIEQGLDIISIHSHLTKLVEAAHLIDIREVTHINGHLKTRI